MAKRTSTPIDTDEKKKANLAGMRKVLDDKNRQNGQPIKARGEYTTEDGLTIVTKWVNPLLIQKVQNGVKFPDPPMYEAVTRSGRAEEWPVTAEIALETEEEYDDEGNLVSKNYVDPTMAARWNYYQKKQAEAAEEQSQRLMRVVFGEGTEFTPPNNGWEEKDELYGIDVPKSELGRKTHYLMYHLSPDDMTGLMTAIMRLTGVDEEMIQEAEASFRGEVHNGPEQAGPVDGSE